MGVQSFWDRVSDLIEMLTGDAPYAGEEAESVTKKVEQAIERVKELKNIASN